MARRVPHPVRERWTWIGVFTSLTPFDYFLLMVLFLGDDVPSYRGNHTDTHVLIEFCDRELPFMPDFHKHELYELYDITSDPWQLDNLLATPAGREEHKALRDELEARMDVLLECAAETCRDGGA